MDSNFANQLRHYLSSRPVWAGIIVGVLMTLTAIFIRPFTFYRYINDPLQFLQPIIQLRFGLINFNWRLPLLHIGFILAISLASPFLLRLLWPQTASPENAVLAARTATLVSIGYIWWLRVDAIPVVIWYAFSTWISFLAISWLTKTVANVFTPKKLRFR